MGCTVSKDNLEQNDIIYTDSDNILYKFDIYVDSSSVSNIKNRRGTLTFTDDDMVLEFADKRIHILYIDIDNWTTNKTRFKIDCKADSRFKRKPYYNLKVTDGIIIAQRLREVCLKLVDFYKLQLKQ